MGPTVLEKSCKKSSLQALKRLVTGTEDESIYKLVPNGRLQVQGAEMTYPSEQEDIQERGVPKANKYKKGPWPSHIDSSQVSNLLKPPNGIRDEMRIQGVVPKDHTRDNRAAILEQSAKNRSDKEKDDHSPVRSRSPFPVAHNRSRAINKIAEEAAAVEKQKQRKISAEPRVPFKPHKSIDFVNKNVFDAVNKQPPLRVRVIETRQKENYGKIPAYLLRRKIEMAQDAEKRLQAEKAKNLPPGVVQMNEDERLDVLKTLESNKRELEHRLRALPLYVETPSQVKIKTTVDSQLRDVEESIRRFSKSTVYIAQE